MISSNNIIKIKVLKHDQCNSKDWSLRKDTWIKSLQRQLNTISHDYVIKNLKNHVKHTKVSVEKRH